MEAEESNNKNKLDGEDQTTHPPDEPYSALSSLGSPISSSNNEFHLLKESNTGDLMEVTCSESNVESSVVGTIPEETTPGTLIPSTNAPSAQSTHGICHPINTVHSKDLDTVTDASPPTQADEQDCNSPEEGVFNDSVNTEKEEGELEEGELEDEDEDKEINEAEMNRIKEKVQDKISRSSPTEGHKNKLEKGATTAKIREGKRKHRERDGEEKNKKKRRQYKEGEQKTGERKKDKSFDFDSLLKQELYLVGGGSTPENFGLDEEGYDSSAYGSLPFKADGESVGSGSGEEWERSMRRRHHRRKRIRSRSGSPSRKNEAVCMFFLQGTCQSGSACPYSHELAKCTRKMELCKFYMMDCCAKKEKCLYMHMDFPCKYFHFGMKCKAGEQCKFSHNSLQEPTKNILLKHIELAPKDILGDFPRLSKHMAYNLLNITLDKRKGETIMDEALETVLEMEGLGFKYLDRAIRSMRKRTGIEKPVKEKIEDSDRDKEKEAKQSEERSLKKPRRMKDEHREHDKEKNREREKDPDRPRDRDRNKDRFREKDRHRSEHNRGANRNEFESDYNRNVPKNEYHPYSPTVSQKHREFFRRIEHNNHSSYDEERNTEKELAAMRQCSGDAQGAVTKWYSSDEDAEINNDLGDRKSYSSNSSGRKNKHSVSSSRHQEDDPLSQDLPQNTDFNNIDFSYFKNLLNQVQSTSSQQSEDPFDAEPKHGEGSNSWAGSQNPKFDRRNSNKYPVDYMDFSNDLKDVFDTSPEPPKQAPRNLTQDLQNLIQTAREKSGVVNTPPKRSDSKEYFRGQESDLNQGQPWYHDEHNSDIRRRLERSVSQDTRENMKEDPRYGKDIPNASWNPDLKQDRHLDHGNHFERGMSASFQDNPNQPDVDLRVPPKREEPPVRQEFNESFVDTDLRVGIYDIDLRQLEMKSSKDILNSLPFKVPMNIPAKEIDGSINLSGQVYYHLIKITIPKPDFSSLKINIDDPKNMDDPRLRKMLRRSSTEEPLSQNFVLPRYDSNGSANEQQRLMDHTVSEGREQRDPRKPPSRDPRADPSISKSFTTAEPRIDPRTDPRTVRVDPRMINSRDPRREAFEPIVEDHREPDPRMAGPVFVSGMMENSQFPNVSAPFIQPGIDPRGRPGLLGAAPGQKGISLSMGGPMGPNPYLLGTPMGAPHGPFLGDREDFMPSVPTFQKGQVWGPGPNIQFNDPRLKRDLGSTFTPLS